MNFFNLFFKLIIRLTESKYSRNRELRDSIDMRNAGSLLHILSNADTLEGVFEPEESNGYVKNNNDVIAKKLSTVNPNFDVKEFVKLSQQILQAVSQNEHRYELASELSAYVSDSFDFASVRLNGIFAFSSSYLHLYSRQGVNEVLQVYVTVIESGTQSDKDARRFFMRFRRRSQFQFMDGRRVKTTSCPNCGAPVLFQDGDTAKCEYCGQYVVFEKVTHQMYEIDEYGWKLYEVEEISKDTYIDNIGVR
jgi:DNA-directed RNA polymerase subunit RPC12/RpoP